MRYHHHHHHLLPLLSACLALILPLRTSCATVSAAERLLQNNNDPPAVVNSPATYTPKEYKFGYRLFTRISDTTRSINAALLIVERAVLSELRTLAKQSGDARLTIEYVGQTTLTPCETWSPNEHDWKFDSCHDAITRIDTAIDPALDANVVETAIFDSILDFTAEFNANHTETPIRMDFTTPVFVAASIRMTFVGVDRVMNAAEAQIVIDSFNSGFGPYMATQASPSMTLLESRFLLQTWSEIVYNDNAEEEDDDDATTNSRRRRAERVLNPDGSTSTSPEAAQLQSSELRGGGRRNHRILQQAPPPRRRRELQATTTTAVATTGGGGMFNDAELYLRVSCASSYGCTEKYLRDFVIQEGSKFTKGWTITLQGLGRNGGTGYFEPLQDILFEGQIVNLPDSSSAVASSSAAQSAVIIAEPANLLWLWITVGVMGGVLLVFAIYGGIASFQRDRQVRAQEEERLAQDQRRAAEEKQRSVNAGGYYADDSVHSADVYVRESVSRMDDYSASGRSGGGGSGGTRIVTETVTRKTTTRRLSH